MSEHTIFEQIQSVKLPTDYLNEEKKTSFQNSSELKLPSLKKENSLNLESNLTYVLSVNNNS